MISKGQKRWFEYHCYEGHDSADAELWYRSHSRVTVLDCENPEFSNMSMKTRCEVGLPLVYSIKFEDGYTRGAFEDELLRTRKEYCRPNPPRRP